MRKDYGRCPLSGMLFHRRLMWTPHVRHSAQHVKSLPVPAIYFPLPDDPAPRTPCWIGLIGPTDKRRKTMRGVLLWALGIPIPVIILLYLFHVI